MTRRHLAVFVASTVFLFVFGGCSSAQQDPDPGNQDPQCGEAGECDG